MNKQQAIGLFRHAITIAGTVLTTSTDVRYQAIGAALIIAAAGHSVSAKRIRPLQVPDMNVPGPHVFMFALLGLASFGLFGCSSVPSSTAPGQAEYAAAITQPVVKNVVVPILSKNPDLEPALVAVATGIEVVFQKGTLTPEQLREFVDALAVKYPKLDERDRLVLGSAIWDAYTIYTQLSGKTIVEVTDPTARAMLEAFRQGITDGIAFYHAFRPTQTSSTRKALETPKITYRATTTPVLLESATIDPPKDEPLVLDVGKGWSIQFGD
jgi:hypothetical protein